MRRRSHAHLALLGLLLMSLAGNALLALALNDAFDKLQFTRIFPAGFAPQPHAQSPAAGRSIAFWGDSRALLWDQSMWNRQMTVENRAHGGMTSSELVHQLWTEGASHTDFAIVQIGINDLHPLGALGSYKAQVLTQLTRNVATVRDGLLARSDVVILTTLFPPWHVPMGRRLAWDPETLNYIDQINAAIRAAADGGRVLLLDAHQLLAGPDGYLAARYVDDDFFLHVNRAAYELLNQHLGQLIERHPSGRS